MNPFLLCDGYKLDHRRQYPKGTTRVYSNFTPRGSRVPGVDRVIFFGLQYFLAHYLGKIFKEHFFGRSALVHTEYAQTLDAYLGPNQIGIQHLSDLRDLGYMPLEFRALPEGTHVPLQVPMFTVENTHPDFFWLVNYLETLLSNVLWLPCTSATTAYRIRKLLDYFAKETGGPLDFVPWQGHDFSFRGMAGVEAATLSGAAHLLSFTGTDTIPAIKFLQRYYSDIPNELIGGSVPATEHSVMCAGGPADELDTFRHLLSLYPSGIVSVVSDTWDLWHVAIHILPILKDQILARDGKLVIRPDSGNPRQILCGNSKHPGTGFRDEAIRLGLVRTLGEVFGSSKNQKGFKELNPKIGVIYGDGINYDTIQDILLELRSIGWASTNVVFGIGSYNYQMVTRDTFNFAMKATWAEVQGEGRDLFKDPATGGGKKSAKGRLSVIPVGEDEEQMRLIQQASPLDMKRSLLKPVWCDGNFVGKFQSLREIRERVAKG